MAEDLRRSIQRSVRLNEPEAEMADGLIGYRGLYEFSDLVRAGLQLLMEQEQRGFQEFGITGARKRQAKAKKGEGK